MYNCVHNYFVPVRHGAKKKPAVKLVSFHVDKQSVCIAEVISNNSDTVDLQEDTEPVET